MTNIKLIGTPENPFIHHHHIVGGEEQQKKNSSKIYSLIKAAFMMYTGYKCYHLCKGKIKLPKELPAKIKNSINSAKKAFSNLSINLPESIETTSPVNTELSPGLQNAYDALANLDYTPIKDIPTPILPEVVNTTEVLEQGPGIIDSISHFASTSAQQVKDALTFGAITSLMSMGIGLKG